jgi:hypothetical protein
LSLILSNSAILSIGDRLSIATIIIATIINITIIIAAIINITIIIATITHALCLVLACRRV